MGADSSDACDPVVLRQVLLVLRHAKFATHIVEDSSVGLAMIIHPVDDEQDRTGLALVGESGPVLTERLVREQVRQARVLGARRLQVISLVPFAPEVVALTQSAPVLLVDRVGFEEAVAALPKPEPGKAGKPTRVGGRSSRFWIGATGIAAVLLMSLGAGGWAFWLNRKVPLLDGGGEAAAEGGVETEPEAIVVEGGDEGPPGLLADSRVPAADAPEAGRDDLPQLVLTERVEVVVEPEHMPAGVGERSVAVVDPPDVGLAPSKQTPAEGAGQANVLANCSDSLNELLGATEYSQKSGRFKRAFLRRLLKRLQTEGFFLGDLRSDFGPEAQGALMAYQKKLGVPVTGRLDSALLAELGLTGMYENEPYRTGESVMNGLDAEMIWVEAGGSGPEAEEGTAEPVMSPGFWMAAKEVTQREWAIVTGIPLEMLGYGDDPSEREANLPVTRVTWAEAQEFCQRLTKKELAFLPKGWRYDLPTGAQWEHVVLCGSPRPAGEKQGTINGDGDAAGLLLPTGTLRANRWGFHDLIGNADEWIRQAQQAPAIASGLRLREGGGDAQTTGLPEAERNPTVGFRVVLVGPDAVR